ncbi:MAG: DUF1800 domain-containing protein [Gemmatimonadales bacterium]
MSLRILLWLTLGATVTAQAQQTMSAGGSAPLTARDSAVHALNRLAWGATPGLIDQVVREGVMRWIERQLAVTDPRDPALRDTEKRFAILQYSETDLLRSFTDVRRDRRRAQAARSDSAGMSPEERRRMAESRGEFRALAGQFQQLAVVRAALSERQLAEVMVDFWTNHFNVFYGKNLDRVYLPGYIERTIRPRALGRFEDLLLATAKSPAMLIYLDNAQSVAPGSRPPALDRMDRARRRPVGRFPGAARRMDSVRQELEQRMPRGLNENYARELLELHTLGVDGGYTQQDVVAVARILTGWSVERPRDGGSFVFNAWAHDRNSKTALGVEFPAGHGQDEGERLIAMLANHPSTMHHVSAKLCARLVLDVPPDGCTDDAVGAWKRSGGEIREVLRAIVRSRDFWSSGGAKVKTPLEFVVSAVRAVGGVPDTTPRLAGAVGRLGQPLYLQTAPTGYPETQEEWVNSGALLARMNLAVALAAGRLPGAAVDLDRLFPLTTDHAALVDAVDRVVLSGTMSAYTRRVIREQLALVRDPAQARALAVGLALGGPDFQRQ